MNEGHTCYLNVSDTYLINTSYLLLKFFPGVWTLIKLQLKTAVFMLSEPQKLSLGMYNFNYLEMFNLNPFDKGFERIRIWKADLIPDSDPIKFNVNLIADTFCSVQNKYHYTNPLSRKKIIGEKIKR